MTKIIYILVIFKIKDLRFLIYPSSKITIISFDVKILDEIISFSFVLKDITYLKSFKSHTLIVLRNLNKNKLKYFIN